MTSCPHGCVTGPPDGPRTVAVGRFRPDGPTGYRAASSPDAPVRTTREDAARDELRAHLATHRHNDDATQEH